MTSLTAPAKTEAPRRQGSHLTVGVLVSNQVSGPYIRPMWLGVMEAARKRGIELICFSGRLLEATGEIQYDSTILAQVSPQNLDGLVLINLNKREVLQQISAVGKVPVASVSVTAPGASAILADNVPGMRAAVEHLITAHGRRRIAFVKGKEGSADGDVRFQAYCDALRAHAISMDTNLVFQGDFNESSGLEAVRVLLDQRPAGFDAVVAANAQMAMGVLAGLAARGKQVPYDVAV